MCFVCPLKETNGMGEGLKKERRDDPASNRREPFSRGSVLCSPHFQLEDSNFTFPSFLHL